MGNCQNYGPFLGPYFNTGPNLGDPKRDHNFDNPPYSVCLEILPFRKKLVAPAQEPRKRKLLSQKESQQAQIGSVCFYAPMGMLPLGRDLIFLAEEAYYF